MSFAEVKELLPTFSAEERASLLECLQALEEGVSVEEFRAIKAAIQEALDDPSPNLTIEEVEAELKAWSLSRAAKA